MVWSSVVRTDIGCGSRSEILSMCERMQVFGLTENNLGLMKLMWDIIEPEIRSIAKTQIDEWNAFCPPSLMVTAERHEHAIATVVDDLRDRFLDPAGAQWFNRAEKRVALAFGSGVSLTNLFAMGGAGSVHTQDVLVRLYDCSKDERHRINDVFFRMRSLECDVYATLYTQLVETRARGDRDQLAAEFENDITGLVHTTSTESHDLRAQTLSSSRLVRAVLAKSDQVAVAAEQSAMAMHDAASTTAGLIRVIKDTRGEVEQAAEIAERASQQAKDAVALSEDLSENAKSIESVLSLIRDIAAQTNLLALNATIEAARAGEAGRGFAVVAQEVKSLAKQTALATDDIAMKVTSIQAATRSNVVTNSSIRAIIADIHDAAGRIREAMGAQALEVTAITSAVDETALAAASMSSTIAMIREETRTVADQIDGVGESFGLLDQRLETLHLSAASFAQNMAA